MRTKLFVTGAILCAATAQAVPTPEHHRQGEIEGTWRVQVTTYNCKSGLQNPPFSSLLTFAQGGTLTGTTANPAFAAGQRSSEMGYWKRTGSDDFRSVTEAFIEFSTPAHGPVPPLTRGLQRIDQAIDMHGNDEFTSEAMLTFFDESGTVLTTACAKAKAQRVE